MCKKALHVMHLNSRIKPGSNDSIFLKFNVYNKLKRKSLMY